MTKIEYDVVVVGGGLAGLAAGATAAKAGARAVVLEAHQLGGRAQTTDRDGFLLNRGGHAFYRGGSGDAVLAELGIRPAGVAPPLDHYQLVADGEHHLLPLTPAALAQTTYLDGQDKAELGRFFDATIALDATTLEGTSTADWLAAMELRPRVDRVVRALLRLSSFAVDFESLSADAAVAQQQTVMKGGVAYLHGGWQQLVDALSALVEVRRGVSVRSVEGDAAGTVVHTAAGPITAGAVVLAPGTPGATRALLPADPGWNDLGAPVTAACLDAGVRGLPSPGFVVSLDAPLYGTTQSPPARQAPSGHSVVAMIRYGATTAVEDRAQLESHLAAIGVDSDDIVTSRFLAKMVVSTAVPTAASGGLPGRPSVNDSGVPRVQIAGDWVGSVGLLADAALASGYAAGLAAAATTGRASMRVA